MSITDFLVNSGCRRYETIECLSDMSYQGIFEKAYWVYTDEDHLVDNIRCKDDECKNPDIGWQSSRGIYRKGKRYYNAVRLGRTKKNAAVGKFTCHFEGESPVSVNIMIGECEVKIILVVSFLSGLYIMKSKIHIYTVFSCMGYKIFNMKCILYCNF